MQDITEQGARREISDNEQKTLIEINKLLNDLCLGVVSLSLIKIYIGRREPLVISENPLSANVSKVIDKEIEKTLNGMYGIIRANTLKSWILGERLGFASLNGKVPLNVLKSYSDKGVFAHREKAVLNFIERTTKGLNLSARVWKLKPAIKLQIETAIQLAALNGNSAIETAINLKQFLKEPEKLFHRVRDAGDKLQLSKAARQYQPGVGVYRSSFKNAFRLARNEINKAYRRADWEQMQDLPFVIGQNIHLSNNHPISDICDNLKGIYPKTFVWSGWHVQCRCHMTKEIISLEDFAKMEQGKFKPKEMTAYPYMFKQWLVENRARIKPNSGIDWIEDNPDVLAILNPRTYQRF